MKSHRTVLTFSTPHRREYLNIMPQIETVVRESVVNTYLKA